jgi:hypothetical protein
MVGPALRDLILEVFEEQPKRVFSAQDVLGAVAHQHPGLQEASVRVKLSELAREGALTKLERAQYQLFTIDQPPRPLEAIAARQLLRVLKPKALRRAVIWDATPFLAQAEDGAPGVRLVIEHPAAETIKNHIESDWAPWVAPFDWGTRDRETAPQLLTWISREHGPLGEQLWEPDEASPSKIHLGIILVAAERIGATGLTPQGYRAPTRERILSEFLTYTVDGAAAADILRAGILDPGFDLKRAEQAALTLGCHHYLHALLAAIHRDLPAKTRAAHLGMAPPFLRAFLEGET